MVRYPSAFGYMLSALDFYLSEPKEIAVVGNLDSHEVRLLVEEIYSRYIPNKVVAASEPGDDFLARLCIGWEAATQPAAAPSGAGLAVPRDAAFL